jgi:deoxyuridine 5'-triphosphate nucleotidohydrolase
MAYLYYLYGWIFARGKLVTDRPDKVEISMKDRNSYDEFSKNVCSDQYEPKTDNLLNGWTSVFVSKEKFGFLVGAPWTKEMIGDNMSNLYDVLQGMFDANGSISYSMDKEPVCCLNFQSGCDNSDIQHQRMRFLQTYIQDLRYSDYDEHLKRITWSGTNAIDFAGHFLSCRDEFYKWLNVNSDVPECIVSKSDSHAILPNKVHSSDVGYDVTIIKEHKRLSNRVTLYDTGIQIKTTHGYYAELVPRSSISKSGYMLANSMGIIDPGYQNNLYVALVKIDPDAPELTLPHRGFQLVFRPHVHVKIQTNQASSSINIIDGNTSRGQGGFGSTGNA